MSEWMGVVVGWVILMDWLDGGCERMEWTRTLTALPVTLLPKNTSMEPQRSRGIKGLDPVSV